MKAAAVAVLGAALLAMAVAPVAGATDECKGLSVCLPVSGPWVVVGAGGTSYELRCPRVGYVVGGVDARAASRGVEVSFRAELGSPIGPGVSTRGTVLVTGVAVAAAPTSFRPFIGCVPTRGGGSRSQTGSSAVPPGGFAPSGPLQRIVVTRPVPAGATTVAARCPAGRPLVGGAHAVAFRVEAPPGPAALAGVRVVRTSTTAGAVVARVRVSAAAASSRPEVQVRATCVSAR